MSRTIMPPRVPHRLSVEGRARNPCECVSGLCHSLERETSHKKSDCFLDREFEEKVSRPNTSTGAELIRNCVAQAVPVRGIQFLLDIAGQYPRSPRKGQETIKMEERQSREGVRSYLHSSKLMNPSWFISISSKKPAILRLGTTRPADLKAA